MDTMDATPDDIFPRSERERFDAARADLNPNFLAGVNEGTLGPHPELQGRTLADVKDIRGRLPELSDADLKRIPVLPEGSRLEQGATYLNLRDPKPKAFVAMGGMSAAPGSLLVPKANVDYVLWNRLTGVQTPERLDEAPPPPQP